MTPEQRKYQREYRRKWRAANKERAKQYEKTSRERRREQRIDYARQYNPSYYANNKELYAQKAKARYELMRAWIWEMLSTLSCVRCGEGDPDCLEFHHRDPKQKKEAILTLAARCSRKMVFEEIAKCDVLCANCHRREHARLRREAEEARRDLEILGV